MRRFLVEAVVDASSLFAVILLLSLISVPPAVPVRIVVGADPRAARGRACRLHHLGRRPRPRQPVRPAGDRRPDRAGAPPDDGPVRHRDQCDRAVADEPHRPDQDRDGGRPVHPLAPRRRRDLHGGLDARGRAPRAQPPVVRAGGPAVRLAAARVAADAAPERAHREPPAPAGLRADLRDRARHHPRADAGRRHPALVRAAGPRRAGHAGRRVRSRAGPGDAPAARPDLREDRPDGGQPGRPAARGVDHRAVQAPERSGPVLRGKTRVR